jgi:restriction system protein
LKTNPERINVKYLSQFPEFRQFRAIKKGRKEKKGQTSILSSLDPKEQLETAYQKIKEKLAHDLLAEVMKASDSFFEKLVVKLVVRMGYGGSMKDAGEAIGGTGDGGVDGVINEDKLGLDKVYIQAKKWKGNVSRPKIQEFIGALHGRQANKGIFITASGFSREAEDYARSVATPKVILIDGEKLIKYMIETNVGVVIEENYELKKVDLDFFTEE